MPDSWPVIFATPSYLHFGLQPLREHQTHDKGSGQRSSLQVAGQLETVDQGVWRRAGEREAEDSKSDERENQWVDSG